MPPTRTADLSDNRSLLFHPGLARTKVQPPSSAAEMRLSSPLFERSMRMSHEAPHTQHQLASTQLGSPFGSKEIQQYIAADQRRAYADEEEGDSDLDMGDDETMHGRRKEEAMSVESDWTYLTGQEPDAKDALSM
jgi:hypothetical protein